MMSLGADIVAAILFQRDGPMAGSVERWPDVMENQEELVIDEEKEMRVGCRMRMKTCNLISAFHAAFLPR